MNDKNTLLSEMRLGSTVITPNNRLSNQLLRDYYKNYAHDFGALKKPNCLPYTSFLKNLYNWVQHTYPLNKHPILLTKLQQNYLWQQILLKNSNYSFNIGLLNAIQDAWGRCQAWQIKIDHAAFTETPQTKQFQKWQQEFQEHLDKLHAITQEQIVDYLFNFPLTKEENITNKIIWVCFDDYTPQQKSLQIYLEKLNYENQSYDHKDTASKPQKYIAEDKQDEFKQMLAWVNNKLQTKDQQIAIVIPNLAEDEKKIKRLLNKYIPNKFNISLGKSLNEFPIITHAIQWLSIGIDGETISNHQARLLLSSPYLADSKAEFINRAEILQKSELLTNNTILISDFILACQKTAPKLTNSLKNLVIYPKYASPMDWVTIFKKRLTNLSFPGEYGLPSASYQSFQRLLALFDEFQQLTIINNNMSVETAIFALNKLIQETIFQLQQPPTPVVVLGLLEASGCTFDSIWICNLHDKCLPGNTNFSAFIPISLQKELLMPHSSAKRELEFATKQLDRFQNSCNEMVVSYANFIDDVPMLASPLINNFPLLTINFTQVISTKIKLIQHEEEYKIPLQNTETITGGTSILANQAKCPFKAFATHRLHASAPESITNGHDAKKRGQDTHKIMEQLWIHLQSQEKLLSINSDYLQNLIEKIILNNITTITFTKNKELEKIIREVELTRLKRLINSVISWEKQRPEFIVAAIEQKFSINLAGIKFNIRVDRIDLIEDNKKLIIDYKSSLPEKNPWNEDRPEEPQLLIYSLLDENINSILFIELKSGSININGLSAQEIEIKGVKLAQKELDWSDYQTKWQQQLLMLANEFKEGVCTPLPLRSSICSQCAFKNLCRI